MYSKKYMNKSIKKYIFLYICWKNAGAECFLIEDKTHYYLKILHRIIIDMLNLSIYGKLRQSVRKVYL